jgi:tRNA-dihydrouridine synthase 1
VREQFCGDDPETILAAAKLIEDQVDAIDLNLGCPQVRIACACI